MTNNIGMTRREAISRAVAGATLLMAGGHACSAAQKPSTPVKIMKQKNSEFYKKDGSFVSSLLPKPPASTSSKPASASVKGGAQHLWVLRDGQLLAVPVSVGVSNGHQTEVSGGDVKPGIQVITESVVTQK